MRTVQEKTWMLNTTIINHVSSAHHRHNKNDVQKVGIDEPGQLWVNGVGVHHEMRADSYHSKILQVVIKLQASRAPSASFTLSFLNPALIPPHGLIHQLPSPGPGSAISAIAVATVSPSSSSRITI